MEKSNLFPNLYPTQWCWNCGRPCKNLFCNDKCKHKYEIGQQKYTHDGKRRGYGLAGSTH